jgi:diaminohydroxyphosphoribosylaminopyrimidine deaminase/5-amino-6-(5-phosphoribosylamino)uracil reductase
MASGQSQWITAPPARRDVQRMRAENCAIITGIGTQKMDDPSLTLRMSYVELGLSVNEVDSGLRQPLRVVVDSQCQMSSSARLLQQDGATLVATTDGALQRQRAAVLESAGAEVIFLPARERRVDLQSLLQHLAERGCNRVLVEAGAGLAGAFVGEGLVDEVVCYWAPKLLGSDARPMFNLPIETIDAHLALSVVDMRRIGEDIRLTLQPEKDY